MDGRALPPAPMSREPAPGRTRPALGHLRDGRSGAAVAGVAWSLVNVAAGSAITIVVYVAASRVLAPGDFGLVALALSVTALVGCLLPTGFADALVQRDGLDEAHVDSVFWLCLAMGALAYGGLLLGAGLVADLAGSPGLGRVLALVGLKIPFDALAAVPAALLARRMAYRSFALRTALANGLGGLVCLVMVWAGQGFWALALSQVVISGIGLAVVATVGGWRPRLRFAARALGDLRAFALASNGIRVLNEARLDQILLGAIAGPATLGLFFFARRLSQMLTDLTVGVFSPVTQVLFASMQHEPDKAREAFLLAGFAATTVGLPAFAGVMAVADTAVPLVFGAQWSEAVLPLRAFCAIGLMAVLGIVQSTLIQGQGFAGWWLGYQAAGQAAGLLVILALYPLFGLDAVMLGLVARTALLWPLSIRKTLRLLDMPLARYLGGIAGPVIATLLMVAAVELLPIVAPSLATWPRLAAEVGTGLATYAVAAGLASRGRLIQLVQLVRAVRTRKRNHL